MPLLEGPAGDYALIRQAGIGVFTASKNAAEAVAFVALGAAKMTTALLDRQGGSIFNRR